MPGGKLKVLSGKTVVRIFERHGFEKVRQVGSHVRLERATDGSIWAITIPLHKELKRGTLKGIANDFGSWLGEKMSREEFYHA